MGSLSDRPTELPSTSQQERILVNRAIQEARPVKQPDNQDESTLVTRDAAAPTADSAAFPSVAISGYQILKKLDGGGQGIVYQALQISTGKKVAVKLIREGPSADPMHRARLERGVRILGDLDHPNIVRIIDSGEVSGVLYYVMDFVAGVPLDDWMESRRQSSVNILAATPRRRFWSTRQRSLASSRRQHADIEETVRLFIKISDAVNAAHVKGIIHRDLKPGNILVDDRGEPHILDFDLAKIVIGDFDPEGRHAEMTKTGEFLGSLRWASPEQVERIPSKIDTRSDVYAIGFMMFESLSGQPPYPVLGSRRDLEDHILGTDPPRLRSLRRQIDEDLDAIVLKCLHKPRERRYQSGAAIADDLRSFIAGAPISARRDNTWYLIRKLARRHAAVTAIIASFVVVLLSAVSISTYYYHRERKAAQEKSILAEESLRQSKESEATAVSAQAGMHRMALGWFLLEWQAGRLQRAKEIRDACPKDTPERLAMHFLLDPRYPPERLLAELPAQDSALGHFVVAERFLSEGDLIKASGAYGEAAESSGKKWYMDAARSRLGQIQNKTSSPN